MNCLKRQKDVTLKDKSPTMKVSTLLLGKSGRQLPEIMKPLGQRGNNAQLWMCPVMKAIQCCKEQYCIGTWNIRPMNQGKLDMVRQEMIRINIDILGISELNGPEWANLIQMTIISTTVDKNPLEKME